MFFDRHALRRLLTVVGALVALSLALPTVAGAQDDPYGGTSTSTTSPADDPTCSLDDTEALVGASVSGTVDGLEVGANVEIRFAGRLVDQVEADDSGSALFSFAVPDVAPGDYEVVAVGATFTVTCGDDLLSVGTAGTGGENPGGENPGGEGTGPAGEGTGQGGGGALARTGANLAPLLALAAALIALGVYLRRRTRPTRLAR